MNDVVKTIVKTTLAVFTIGLGVGIGQSKNTHNKNEKNEKK